MLLAWRATRVPCDVDRTPRTSIACARQPVVIAFVESADGQAVPGRIGAANRTW